MKTKLILAAALTAAAFAVPQTASADSLAIQLKLPGVSVAAGNGSYGHDRWEHDRRDHDRRYHRSTISAREAVGIVYRAGYRRAYIVETRGSRYTVSAVDMRGRRVFVEVSAYSGAITGKRYAWR
ncbi:MAG: hypothetical protein H6883_13840 [Rhodobiaceae bacterium]|nr:hypothetical protein [Rhodobiaceae bacterium]MCC0057200.1 hypothetical protein [Rhodobiaceae bacterium]